MFDLPKLPEGKEYGFLFNIATGRMLDVYGEREGIPRKKWLFFKEPDFMYKNRMVKEVLSRP